MDAPRGELRPYGRRAFLGLVVVGVGALLAGRPFRRLASVDLAGGGGWRIYTVADTMPVFDPVTWRLRVGGLVERPLELTYRELLALPQARETATFHCVTGWSVANVRWQGVRLSTLLAAARPLPGARALHVVSAERPYDDSLTLAQARAHDVLLAHTMNGVPLPREHGAPARIVIPSMYGYKNVKWVERIDLVRAPLDGYWEQRGYDRDAWVGRSNGWGA